MVDGLAPRDDIAILSVRFDDTAACHGSRYGVWNWTFDATDGAAAAATREEIGGILRDRGMAGADVTSACMALEQFNASGATAQLAQGGTCCVIGDLLVGDGLDELTYPQAAGVA